MTQESDLILVLWGHRTGNQRSQLIWGSRNPREVSDLPCDCIFFERNLTNISQLAIVLSVEGPAMNQTDTVLALVGLMV